MLHRAAEPEFPGLPSTQEWREDFPSTQIPPQKPRTAYITPQTSFLVPPNEAETDGFDIEVLTQALHTPTEQLNKLGRTPPTPMSIKKHDSSREKGDNSLNMQCDDTSTLKSEEILQSPIQQTRKVAQLEGAKIPCRRRRRPKKHKRNLLPSSEPSDQNISDAESAVPFPSTNPEPWPVPFPLADIGIYPYLPPAKQFDQMVKFTSATENHIDKWDLHNSTYPVPLLRQVLSAQERVHMGFWSQLEYMDKLLGDLEELMKPISAKERARRGKSAEKYKRITPQMLAMIKFMRSITKQQQICFYQSRIPTRPESRRHLDDDLST